MSRRRLSSTGLQPNFRYPLVTPDHEHESFIDYDSYDGDAGRSRDHSVYPTYQPREKSPAPQIVRAAKQPEMIRRQSLRPFSGDWGNFDAVSAVDDSKLPGSFQDTDREALDPDFFAHVPRSTYPHSAEIADLDSDKSDENLDFGHDEPLVFPQLPLEDVVLEVGYILRTKSNPPGDGFTYVFADPTGRNKFYRIGSAKNVSKRANDHHNICNLSYFRSQKKPATPIRQYKRLEKLAQAELINMSYDPNCVCGTQQRQYFWGREQTAFEILEFWTKWLVTYSPYNKSGQLQPFWEYRLRVFEANIQKCFDCQGSKCIKRTADPVACPICLRTGWKAWAEPSGLDKIEFACRTQINNEWVHRALFYLYKHVPIQDSVWVTSIDGICQAASMVDRFRSPVILLNILYGRLLLPIIWSTIFTTADYVSFIAIVEVVMYSVIYQLVRLELSRLTDGPISERLSKEGRLVRRKALPSTLDKPGDEASGTKEPRVLEIPDDRVQNVLKQATTSGKGAGKKSESASALFPGEAAARPRKLKPSRRRSDFI